MTVMTSLHVLALASMLGAAVVMDLRERRIPNRITAGGFVVAVLLGIPLEGGFPVAALAGALLGLILTLPFVALGGLGGGDSKLFMAVGAFVGPLGLLSAAVYGAFAGGILAVANAIRRGALLGVLINLRNLLLHAVTGGRAGERVSLSSPGAQTIPYGLAIAVGAVLAWFFPLFLGGGL